MQGCQSPTQWSERRGLVIYYVKRCSSSYAKGHETGNFMVPWPKRMMLFSGELISETISGKTRLVSMVLAPARIFEPRTSNKKNLTRCTTMKTVDLGSTAKRALLSDNNFMRKLKLYLIECRKQSFYLRLVQHVHA